MFKLVKLIFSPVLWILRLVGIGGSLPVEVDIETPMGLDDALDAVTEPSTKQAKSPTPKPVEPEVGKTEPVATEGAKRSGGSPFRVGKTDFDVRVSKLGLAISEATGLPGGACSVGARVIHDFIANRLILKGDFTLIRVGTFKLDRRSKKTRFKASPVLRKWIQESGQGTAVWPHAMSAAEEHRIRYWEPAARNGLGDAGPSKSVDGLSTRRHLAWALHKNSQMPLKWAVLMVRGWEEAIVATLLNTGRLQAKGLGNFKVHKVAGKSGGINGAIGPYVYVTYTPAKAVRQSV
jgi:nucleoid DNA-binding protein